MLAAALSILLSLTCSSAGAQDVSTETAVSTAAVDAALLLPPSLDVVWPRDKDRLPFVTRSFTFGSVQSGSTLSVNGATVPVGHNGAFFAMVPFSSGSFALDYRAEWKGQETSTRVSVEVGQPFGLPELKAGGVLALDPSADLVVLPGDIVLARCYGPAGGRASFRIAHLADALPMAERSGVPGLYEGHYIVQPKDKGQGHKLVCAVKTKEWGNLKAEAAGKVSLGDPALRRVGSTTSRLSILKTQRGGYTLFLPPGVLLELKGKAGSMFRVALADDYDAWLDEGSVSLLPEGTPPPRGQVGRSVLTSSDGESSRLTIDTDVQLPFEVVENVEPLGFEIRFYGAMQRFDRMRYAFDDPVIDGIGWRQESSRVVAVRVGTRLSWGWGYDAGYDASGRFFLDIRRPPDLSRTANVLAGRRVIVDPGHGPQPSATGPLGTTERDINLAIAMRVQDRLLAEGADVYMIRTSTDGPPLGDRPFIAWGQRGDLYVSVHNNALPVTADPFDKPRGFMTFFYQPHSQALAEAVHDSYRTRMSELADEGVQWGDLAVCRLTQMPSTLTETAYMILPQQETMLRDPAFQERAARTIVEGLRAFYNRYRSIQLSSDAERLAARR